jgi:hypothetical protein
MDWKLIIGYNDIPFLKNYNKGDNCKREIELGDLAASKSVELDELDKEIEFLEKHEQLAEKSGDLGSVGVFYKTKWKMRIKREKVLDEFRKLRSEELAEAWKNRRLLVYYTELRDHKAKDFKRPK